MAKIFLVSENTVREITNVDDNLQSKFLKAAITESQMEYERVIGSKLYRKLETLVETGDISLPENKKYKDLLDRSKYFLAYSTMTNVIVITAVKIGNAGAMANSDEHLQNVGMKDAMTLENYYKRKADNYLRELQRYLVKYRNNYVELSQYDIADLHSNLYSAYSGGLSLGNARGRDRYVSKNPVFSLDNPNPDPND